MEEAISYTVYLCCKPCKCNRIQAVEQFSSLKLYVGHTLVFISFNVVKCFPFFSFSLFLYNWQKNCASTSNLLVYLKDKLSFILLYLPIQTLQPQHFPPRPSPPRFPWPRLERPPQRRSPSPARPRPQTVTRDSRTVPARPKHPMTTTWRRVKDQNWVPFTMLYLLHVCLV